MLERFVAHFQRILREGANVIARADGLAKLSADMKAGGKEIHTIQADLSRPEQTCGSGAPPPAAVCGNGVMDRVLHPVEPLTIRLSLVGRF
ncbi:hypothetical protein [Afipia birgiae]|uniref:hypothetical protein n=1 Tax=Afipia birgiae TaxID=151414 RepID=UPI00030268CB|nr:hypothetical protein [Afipia birgiae]MBX9821782.1 hypothetical protein [Afipia birgiae]